MLVTVFGIYFLIVFLIGWLSLRSTRDASDYWIAGGRLGWALGGATLSATHTSAGTFIGTIGLIYTVGWSFTWVIFSIPLAYWFTAAILAPRFTRERHLTLPAFIEARFESRAARGVAAGAILLATVVYIQAQIIAGGLVAEVVFGIPASQGMIIFTLILLAYTMIGGMIAVVYTDMLQLVIMVIGVIVAVPLTFRHFGGLENLFFLVQSVKPDTFAWGSLPTALVLTMSLAFFLGSVATPEKVIRLYAMRDMRTIRRGIWFTMWIVTGVNVLVFLLALAAMVLFPELPTGDIAMPLIAKAVLPPLVGALLLAAITSAMMSTVDSLLLVAGSALSEDIYGMVRPDASDSSRMLVARTGILVVGVAPLILIFSGIGEGELVQLIVVLFSALMASSFFVPVVGSLFWRRASSLGAIAAMIGGFVAAICWKAWGASSIDPVLLGVGVSLALFVSVSLLSRPPSMAAIERFVADPE